MRRLCVVVTPSGEMMLDFLELALLKLELLVNFPFASNLDLLVTAAAEAVSAENPSPCNLKNKKSEISPPIMTRIEDSPIGGHGGSL